ncbi:sulfite exporter TauE/SafE family protein [Salipiger sp.]|uniref:sulfite exporter TauE/SafE family protein n=1 Tax=Salipiger sp. TaxID=2078585 RepID=UPI003A971B0C
MHDALAHFAAHPWLAAIALVVVFAGAVVQFSLGMGFGLTVAPVLAVIDPVLVPVPTLLMSLAVSALGAFRERGAIVWPEALTAAGGRLTGALIAAVILGGLVASRDGFSLVFGCLILVAVVLSVAGLKLAFTRTNIYGMGVVSGIMATITSVGAPPLAIVYQGQPARQARPTLAATFTFGTIFSVSGLILSGWAGWSDVWFALLLAPGTVAGYYAARALGPAMDARYRAFLLAISGMAGVVLVLRGLT